MQGESKLNALLASLKGEPRCFDCPRANVMTPRFDHTIDCLEYNRIYGSLSRTKYKRKCPDLLIDGKWYEHEGFTTKNPKHALRNMLNHGLEQSNRIIIEDCGASDWSIKNSILRKINAGIDIKEVWIHKDNKIIPFYKNTEG